MCFSVGRAASDEEVYIVSMALMDDPFVRKVGDEICYKMTIFFSIRVNDDIVV